MTVGILISLCAYFTLYEFAGIGFIRVVLATLAGLALPMVVGAMASLYPAIVAARTQPAEAVITFTGGLGQAGELDFFPERIGGWWNRDTEIDVLAINLSEKIAFVGECKWTVYPIGISVLDDLKQKVVLLTKDHEIKKVQFAIFARNGFTTDLEDRSRIEGIHLFTIDTLVNQV